MRVKYTLVDATSVEKDGFSFDNDAKTVFESLLGQMISVAPLYDTEGDYYISFVSPSVLNDTDKVIDYDIAFDNNNGEIIDGAFYDSLSGIAYIPKTAVSTNLYDDGVQIQLALEHNTNEAVDNIPVDITVNNFVNDNNVQSISSLEVNELDSEISVPLIGSATASLYEVTDFDVYLNDSPNRLSVLEFGYDANSGTLSIPGSPTTTLSVRIDVNSHDERNINDYGISLLSAEGDWQERTAGSWTCLPNVTLTNAGWYDIPVGKVFAYNAQGVASGGSADELRIIRHFKKYMYGSSHIGSGGANEADSIIYNEIKNGGTLDTMFDKNVTSYIHLLNNSDYATFLSALPETQHRSQIGNTVDVLQELADKLRSQNEPWYQTGGTTDKGGSGGWMYPCLPLQCSHVANPIGTWTGAYSKNVPTRLTLLVRQENVSQPYMVFGLISAMSGTQAGCGMFKVKLKKKDEPKKAKLYVQKRAKGTAPAGASFAGARYNIYRDTNSGTGDGSGRQEIACDPLVTNASGYAISKEIEEGWYWVHETPPDASAAVSKYYELDYEHGCGERPVWYKAGTVTWYKPNDNGWYHVYAKASDLPKGSPIAYQNGNSSIKWVYETPLTGSITLQKTDDGGHNLGSGFSFQLYRNSVSSSNKVGGVKSTSQSGKVEWTGLAPGRYIIKEVTSKFPYLLNNGQVTVNVTAGSTQSLNPTIEFENEEQTTGQVTIYKRDANTNSLLSGFKFKIRKGSSSGAYLTVNGVSQWTTGSSGSVTITGIPFGTYYVEEVGVPSKSNYTFADGTERFTISASSEAATKAVVTFYNEKNYGEIELTKVDTDNSNRPISGAQFALYADEAISNDSGTWYSSGQRISTQTTGSDGKITWTNLPLKSDGTAKYRIEEVNVPSPYVCLTKTQQVTLSKGNSRVATKYVTIGNEQARGEVSLIKKDEKGNLVDGAKFELRAAENVVVNGQTIYTNNQLIDTLTTGADGKVSKGDLPIGNDGSTTYKFVEISVPAPYVKQNGGTYNVTLNHDGQSKTVKASVDAVNGIATASIKIIKQDQDDASVKVEGAKFDVHAVDDVFLPNGDKLVSAGDKVGSITTNASGEATIEGLYVSAEGTDYSFTETYVPAPYEKETTPVIVTVKYKDMDTPVISATKTIENHKLQGKLTVTKTDSGTDRPIQDVVFDIIADEDIIREGETTPLIEKDTVAATITTGEDGTASYDRLPIGAGDTAKYRVVEKDAPKPYVVDSTPRHIQFVRQSDEATILYGMDWENTPQEGHVILNKKDTLDNVVEGVTFDVYATEDVVVNGQTIYKNNQKIATLTTDDTGMLDIDGIAIGDDGDTRLKFVEVTAPVPYIKQGNGEYPITLKFKNGVAKVDGEIEATNDIATAQIDITKLDDDTDDPIEGAVFDVYARETVTLPNGDVLVEKDEKIDTITTNAEGKASIDGLYVDADGTPYEFVETSVPRPYVIPQETTTVTVKYKDINTAHVTATATITNMTTPGVIDVIKDDSETHKPVEGAVFDIIANEEIRINGKLIHSKGDKVGTVTTDEDGRASTKYLKLGDDGDGKYIVREISVPSPYIISGSPDHEITINYDHEATEAIHVECPVTDDIVTGKVSLHKSDDETGEAIAGAVFDVVATEQIKLPNGHVFHEKDDVVDTITTDADGNASIDHLYVGDDGDGQYKFVEKSVPMPYIITHAETPFTITQSDMTTAVVSVSKDIKNDIAKGKATITKTDDGTGRKLAGAKFDVVAREDIEYPNGDVKVANGTVVETVTTNENGQATTSELLIGADGNGKYAFVEVAAPEGYLLDSTDVSFTLIYDEDNPLVSVNATKTDNPIRGGVEMPKIDTELSKYEGQEDETGNPQGNATVEGAVFDIISLNDYEVVVDGNKFSKDEVVKTITTNEDGIASTSNECLQYGDYKLVEKTAPEGYKLTDEEWLFSITTNGDIVKPADVDARIDNQIIRGGVEMPKVDAELISEDVVGDAAQTDEEDNPQGDSTLDGAEFSITNRSAHHVIVGGKLYEPNETIATIPRGVGGEDGETYETIITVDGVASTAADALPYGTYEIKEVKAPEGYLLNTADSWTFTITEDGKMVRPSTATDKMEDTPIRGGVAMPKVDTELSQFAGEEQKEGNPQGNATVEGAEFTIRNESQHQVVVNGKIYENGQDVITIRTGDDGIATTGALTLPYGSYTIRETKQPTGYLESTVNHDGDEGEVWAFEIRENGTIVRPAIDDVEHKIDNQVIRGDVEMPKIDTELSTYSGQDDATNNPQGGATVSGAEFTIKNKSAHHVIVNGKLYQPEEDVAKIVTGDDGIARTTGKALPYGTYELRETKAPEGYHLTPETFTFSIRTDGEVVKQKSVDEKIDNQVIRGGVAMPKVDTEFSELIDGGDMEENFITDENHPQGDATVDGAEFSITNVSEHHVIVGGKLYESGDRITTIPDANRTDKTYDTIITVDGIASTTANALPYGTYELREVKSPTGYHESTMNHDDDESGEVWTFSITEEGVIVRPNKETQVEDKIDNQIIRGGVEMPKIDTEISKYAGQEDETNPQGDATLEGTTFSLTNVSKSEVYVGGQVYASGDRIMTIPDGNADGAISDVITTDADGIARTTVDALPYGTYELREVEEPTGYNHSSFNHKDDESGEVYTFTIRTEDEIARPDKEDGVEDKIDNRVIRGGVRLPKLDADLSNIEGYENKENQPTGDATLDGAEFAIDNVSKSHVIVGGKLYETGERIASIPDGNKDGKTASVIVTVDGVAQTTADALPYGTYEIYEVKAPEGYELSTDRFTFTIREEGVIVQPTDEDGKAAIKDQSTTTETGGIKIDAELSRYADDVAAGNDDQTDEEQSGDESTEGTENAEENSGVDTLAFDDAQPSANAAGIDMNPLTNAQGDATLEDAEFSLTNRSKDIVVIGGKVYKPGERITTIPLPDGTYGDVVKSDVTGYIDFGDEGLPYGTYELAEVKAPYGYNLSDDTWVVTVHGDKNADAIPRDYAEQKATSSSPEVVPETKDDAIEDDVIRGGLSVQKVDKETGRGNTIVTGVKSDDDKADSDESADDANIDAQADEASDGDNVNEGSVELGDDVENGSSDDADASGDAEFHNASLAGTMFEIRNASEKAVIVDGKLYQTGQVVKTITTDDKGYAATTADALPFGTYDVYESGAPNGYLSSADSYGNSDGADDDDEKAYVQTVEIREEGVIVPCARPFVNQIKRGDIKFTKIDDDGNVMPHVAFKVTSKTTGESHIIVTDENGVFNSSSAVIPHSQNTNGSDGAFDKNGNIQDDELAYDAGLWFYGNVDGKAFAGDGTLPNNVDRFGFDSENDDATDGNVDADDENTDDMSGDASGDDGLVLGDDIENGSDSSAGSSGAPAHVNPVYEVTGEDDAPKQVTIGYVATDENGSFDKNSVVFNADGSITVVYDKTVVNAETGERRSYTSYETYADSSWKVIVTGSDMLDGANADGIADADGNGEYDIVDNPDAYATSSQYPIRSVDDNLGAFPYDQYIFEELPSKATEGRNLVVFEATIQRHNYVLNLGPITDNIIDIRTTATDQSDGDHIMTTDEKVTIVDRVEYTNLNTDREYTMTGTLMDYETGEPMTDANGNTITSSVTFKPESPNGSIDVVFELDATQLGGVQTVVFEDLYWNNIHIASHADIEDKNQLVEFHPEIGTVAVGDQTNDHYVYDDGSVIIVDTVHYKGVVPGREFIVHGILMDKNTGDALVDANGETVENSVVFTPETSEGDVQVLFEFDASTLAGLDIVAFENLYRIDTVTNRQPDENVNDGDEANGQSDDITTAQRLVASHTDINDEGQTVSVRASGLASDQIANDLVQTGVIAGLGLAIAATVGGAAYTINKKRKQHNAKR